MSLHKVVILSAVITIIALVGIFNHDYDPSHNVKAEVTPIITLDKNVYTWTDRVNISVTAPDQNLDANKIDTINVSVSTRGNSINQYKLVETGLDTGIFTGFVTLTGDPNIKGSIGVDGKGKNPTGDGPSGVGPRDGLLPSEESDGVGVTFQTQNQSVIASALIHWNLGQVTWLAPSNTRVLQIIDPDMNLNPNAIDSFLTPVFSNSDLAGITLNMTETGPDTSIFQGIVHFTNFTSSGNRLHLSGGNNTITGDYTDRTLPPPYTSVDQIVINSTTNIINGNTTTAGQPLVKLDKSAYTWTDRVGITVITPSLNLDPNKIETIGNNGLGKIAISTRGHTIFPYNLVETGPNTGIFTGYVVLTGNPNIKDIGGVDGNGLEPTGAGPSGIGPKNGLLPAENIDGISVTFQTPTQTAIATAPIQWNIGQVSWLKLIYPANGQGMCRIVDPDMNLNPLAVDKFYANVWSTTDSGGIKLSMNETGYSTGVFQGIVFFTNSVSSGNRLHVNPNDIVTCEYKDRTLPAPYTPADQFRLTSTAVIQTVPTIPTSITITSSVNPSVFGQSVSFPVTVQFPLGSPYAPSGSVNFFDGKTLLGTITVPPELPPTPWNVTLDIGSLTVGSHSITAKYSGDVKFSSSNSTILIQTVNN